MRSPLIIQNESDKARAINQITRLNPEKVWEMSVKPYKPNRSKSQNKLYWSWLQIIGDDLGYPKEELHVILAAKFLGIVETRCLGEIITQPVSTSTLNVKGFAEYLNGIELFAGSELGIILPNQDDLYFESMGIKRK